MKNLIIDKSSKDNGEKREMILRNKNISSAVADSTWNIINETL